VGGLNVWLGVELTRGMWEEWELSMDGLNVWSGVGRTVGMWGECWGVADSNGTEGKTLDELIGIGKGNTFS